MTESDEAPATPDGHRLEGRRDRTARLLNVLGVLCGHGEAGVRPEQIARRTNMSKRTVHRDLVALQSELGMPLWSKDGRWGVQPGAFLPPMRLTLPEAMAVFLAARVITRYADRYDPSLSSAFVKLAAALPGAVREHVERTLNDLANRPLDLAYNRMVSDLTKAWAEQRVVRFRYTRAAYDGADHEAHWREVRPYLLEPSLVTKALYLIGFDETRQAVRTFKIERIEDLTVLPQTFEGPPETFGDDLRRAWDMIADQPETEVVLRFSAQVADRVAETTWHPREETEDGPGGTLEWRATVSGTVEIRLWILSWGDDVEVLAPMSLREDMAETHRRAAERYRSG